MQSAACCRRMSASRKKKVKVKRDKILKRYVLIWPICLVKQRRKICILCLRVVFCLDFIYLCLPCCKTHRTPLHNIPPKTPCAPFNHEVCFSCWAVGASIGCYPYQKWSSIKAHNITGRCAYWFFFFVPPLLLNILIVLYQNMHT